VAKTYRYRFRGAAGTLVDRLKHEAQSYKVDATGDEKSGKVEGLGIKARYTIAADVVTITVDKIPFIISWGTVEKELDNMAPNWGATRLT